ncbi:MAG TPA: ThuA domain-containing protein, partial [Planctomycetia bacterium]|nr:ThuA domain-containing protein [Planctomycetia bacterium]
KESAIVTFASFGQVTLKSAPQPVAGWFASPGEIQIAFDRPLSDEWVRSIPKSAKLDFGPHVQPGDRLETFRPGYAVVARQMMAWRDQISLGDAAVTADRRTLLLRTNPMFDAVGYAASLPSPAKPPPATSGAIRGREEIDVGVGATGVEVEANVGADRWSGWLPHPELKVALALLQGSASHERLGELLARKEPTGLKFRTQMRLADLLRPAVQPGDKIDYVWPKESAIVTFASFGQVTLKSARGIVTAGKDDAGRNTAILTLRDAAAPVAVELEVAAPAGGVDLVCWFGTDEDPRRRPLPLRRFLLPWAREESATAEQAPVEFPELAGGDWGRGRRLFLGEKAACAKCHVLDGGGGTIGPSLDNVRRRDYASVRRDLLDPNFALNPEHLSYLVAAKDGRQFAGVMRTEGDVIKIGTAEGQIVALPKNEVESIKPSGKSIMPANLGASLGEADLRDLLTYLLREPPRLPIPPGMQVPKPRKLADVQAVLAGSETIKDPSKLKLLLVSGPKDHGPGEHDYPAWKKAWSELFAVAPGVDIEAVDGWPTEKQWDEARAAVIYQHGTFDAKRARDIDRFLERGGGLSYVHWAVDGAPDGKGLASRIGLAAGGPIKFRHGPLALEFAKEPHPITRNVRNFPMVDESYWMLAGDPAKIRTLGWSPEDGKLQPQYWTVEQGRGRVFVSIPGHFSHSFQDPLFRILLFRGILWSARESVDRFNDLVLLGADVEK